MPAASSHIVRSFLPIWRRALADKSGATFAEVVASGVTVLTFDEPGLIVNVALHHRPLGAVLAYSAEMGRRLGNSVGVDVFYPDPSRQFMAEQETDMITHRFAEAAERRDGAAMAALFADDVTYHTPTLTADLHSKDLTLRYLAAGTRIVDELEYTDQVSDDERLILFWKGILDQREISGATVLAGESGGLIRDITVLQRPWGVTASFRDGILPALADVVPLTAWQLDDGKAPAPDPDAGAGQRPGGPLALSPHIAFHSAMLTKTLRGPAQVEAYHQLMDRIQGPREYLARFTPAGGLVEFWNCVIDGHLLQGIDVFQLDDSGRVADQTVWLRPWPVVTLLRDRAIAASLPFLTADYWRLPAGPSYLP